MKSIRKAFIASTILSLTCIGVSCKQTTHESQTLGGKRKAASGPVEPLVLPKTFKMNQTAGYKLHADVKTASGSKLAQIDESGWSAFVGFSQGATIYNSRKQELGSFGTDVISTGRQTRVYDENEKEIAVIDERAFDSIKGEGRYFDIKNASGKVIATAYRSGISDIGETKMVIKSVNGVVIASFLQKRFQVAEPWDVTLVQPKALDSRIILAFGSTEAIRDFAGKRDTAKKIGKAIINGLLK